MRSLLPKKYHSYIYIFSLVLLVAGLPLSKFLISLSQIILICNWVLGGDLKNKFISFWRNKAAVVAGSLLLIHLAGLLYSADLNDGFRDVRIKIPLLLLPLILSSSEPLSTRVRNMILKVLIAAIALSTLIDALVLFDVIHRKIADVRYASIFISHVRLALLVCVAIFSCVWLYLQEEERKWRVVFPVITAWFIVFLILMQSITGITVLFIASAAYVLYRLFRTKRTLLKYSILLIIAAVIGGTVLFVGSIYQRYSSRDVVDVTALDKTTAQGHPYKNDLSANVPAENGHYVWIYYCEEELRQEWNKRSKMDFDGLNMRGDSLKFTLVRFMTSKDLRKDVEGMRKLSDAEIGAIEKGIANVDYMSKLKGRISEIIWEIKLYQANGDANGHSITQRFEYWKAAIGIIESHPLFGVGTGDTQAAFDAQYQANGTTLAKEWRLRSHNQYLSIGVAFGIVGLIWFFVSLLYPALRLGRFRDLLYFTFFMVAIASFFTEDTLETQVGVTFYAFLNSFFLFTGTGKEENPL